MYKLNKHPPLSSTVPSFSSTLLDEIYRSIDRGDEKTSYTNRVALKQSNLNGGSVSAKATKRTKPNENQSLNRASLIENWIESNGKYQHFGNDPKFLGSDVSVKSIRPKPIRTDSKRGSNYHDENEFSYLENYLFQNRKLQQRDSKNADDGSMKSKSRALKIYNNLKKMKQPISPGARLSGFLNSLFNNGITKKTKSYSSSSISTENSTCSSASSYTRSCLTKNNLSRRSSNGEKRSVSFHPVSVIIDEDNRACGHKSVYKGDFKVDKALIRRDYLNGYGKFDQEEEEDDDVASDSSSDLFELDHLSFMENNGKYCEELPVYETTRLDMNFAIANRLVC